MIKILISSVSKPFLTRNSDLLTRVDFQIITTHSGNDALRLHTERSFDIIISDMQLEDMGGDELCAAIRGNSMAPRAAFILICHDKPEEHARADTSGADAKIIRPIQPEQIIDTVSSLLGVQIGRTKRVIFKVLVLSKKGEVKFQCESLDISITGIMLETEYHLVLGDRIICQFTLPDAGQITTEGDVVRTVKTTEGCYRYGIQFVGLPLTSRREIERYVASVIRK